MISLDFSFVYQILIFLVLWIVLRKVLFHPYIALLEERERKTSGAVHETGDLEQQSARLKAQYEEKIAQVKATGNTAKEAIVHEARRQREQILIEARQRATSALQQVRQEVQAQLEKERQRAAAEIPDLARDMVTKILGRSLT